MAKGDEIIENEKIDQRASSNKLYALCYKIIRSTPFNYTVRICILVNTLVMALDRHPIEKTMAEILEYANIMFGLIFIIEMSIMVMAIGV